MIIIYLTRKEKILSKPQEIRNISQILKKRLEKKLVSKNVFHTFSRI